MHNSIYPLMLADIRHAAEVACEHGGRRSAIPQAARARVLAYTNAHRLGKDAQSEAASAKGPLMNKSIEDRARGARLARRED